MGHTIAVILSGGRSSRMGRDKAELPLGGETFLERLTTGFTPLFDRVYVSVDQPGRYPGRRELPDLRPGQGPLAGLEAAFRSTEAEAVFLAAVDLPFAAPALAAKVLERAGEGDVGQADDVTMVQDDAITKLQFVLSDESGVHFFFVQRGAMYEAFSRNFFDFNHQMFPAHTFRLARYLTSG